MEGKIWIPLFGYIVIEWNGILINFSFLCQELPK